MAIGPCATFKLLGLEENNEGSLAIFQLKASIAAMVELVDTRDLKSLGQ